MTLRKINLFYDDDNDDADDAAELGLLGLCSFLFLHPYKVKQYRQRKTGK